MRPWKNDARPQRGSWAPGKYLNNCRKCGDDFIGDKRAGMCADCAYAQPEGGESREGWRSGDAGTMPGAARSDARANGPSVAETVKELRAEAEKAEPSWSSGVDPEVLNRAADMLEASAQQISAPLPIPRQLEEALQDLRGQIFNAKMGRAGWLADTWLAKIDAALAGAQPKDDSSS